MLNEKNRRHHSFVIIINVLFIICTRETCSFKFSFVLYSNNDIIHNQVIGEYTIAHMKHYIEILDRKNFGT